MLKLFDFGRLPERLRDLKKMSLFVDLNRREMRVVDGFMHDRTYLKGEIIFDAGEEGQAIYLILKGKALVCHQDRVDSPIALLEAGNFFGELALLDDGPRSAQVRAAENCTVVVMFRGDFINLMHSHAFIASKISLQLGRHLGGRLRKALRDNDQELL
jgi:CRP/FNR family cyclic AMP-dependent transcriptional regulator